jgi:tetratricopeptide (TPR) repeat protein
MKKKLLKQSLFFIMTLTAVIVSACTRLNILAPGGKALTLYVRAAERYNEGRYEESANLLKGIRFFIPALVLRGKSFFFLSQFDKAERSFRTALFLSPPQIESALYLARIFRAQGESAKAAETVKSILANDRGNVAALRLAALIEEDLHPDNDGQAAPYLERALESSQEIALVFLERARLRWKSGDAAGSLRDIEAAKTIAAGGGPIYLAAENLEKIMLGKH